MPIYMVKAGSLPIVKIGITSRILSRMASLQASHWEDLKLIRYWDGGWSAERHLHTLFADMHLRREWFTFSRAMLGDVGLVDLAIPVIPPNEPEHARQRQVDAMKRHWANPEWRARNADLRAIRESYWSQRAPQPAPADPAPQPVAA